jgi:hypothetical protein
MMIRSKTAQRKRVTEKERRKTYFLAKKEQESTMVKTFRFSSFVEKNPTIPNL